MADKIRGLLCILLTTLMLFIQFNSVHAGQTKNEVVIDCGNIPDNPVTCLACNIYHESRSESIPGQWMVALATLNRVEGDLYPAKKISTGPKIKKMGYQDQFCQVVYEQRKHKDTGKWTPMYSWTRDGKKDLVYNRGKWYDALEMAALVVASNDGSGTRIPDITYGCQWYHTVDITPTVKWRKDYFPTVTIGNHICYAKNEQAFLNAIHEHLPGVGMLRAVNMDSEIYAVDKAVHK